MPTYTQTTQATLTVRLEALRKAAIEDGSGFTGFWSAFNSSDWTGWDYSPDSIRMIAEAMVGTDPSDSDWDSARVRRRMLLQRIEGVLRDVQAELKGLV